MSNHSWHSLLPASLRSGVLGPAAVLAGGNAVGMGVGLAAAPMLCRLYTPDEFGNFAVFSVTAAMLGAVCTLRFEQAIPLPRSRRMAAALTSVAALQVVFYSVGFTILAFALGWTDARDSFVSLVPWIPAALLCFVAYQIVSAWAVRDELFATLAQMRVAYALISLAVQFIWPYIGIKGAAGLIAGQVIGFGVAALWGSLAARALLACHTVVDGRYLRLAAQRYANYPRFDMPSALLNQASLHGPSLLIAVCFGATVAGWYALAHRLLAAPLTILSHTVSRAYYSRAARMSTNHHWPELANLFRITLAQVAAIALPPLGCAAVLAPWTFGLLFSADWQPAGTMFALLAPLLSAYLLATVITPTFDVLGRQHLRLVREASAAVAIVVGILVPWWANATPFQAVALASLLGASAHLMAIGLAHYALASVANERDVQECVDFAPPPLPAQAA